jgi:hypothetical protein
VKRTLLSTLALLSIAAVSIAGSPTPTSTKAANKTPAVKPSTPSATGQTCPPTTTSKQIQAGPPSPETSPGEHRRELVCIRGEVVDFYCYIEKGATGPNHRDCGMQCVAGDICMGILSDDSQLYMISVDHLRAMTPLAYEGIPNPWQECRKYMAEKVDLTGYYMERKGQKIIEIVKVKKV